MLFASQKSCFEPKFAVAKTVKIFEGILFCAVNICFVTSCFCYILSIISSDAYLLKPYLHAKSFRKIM